MKMSNYQNVSEAEIRQFIEKELSDQKMEELFELYEQDADFRSLVDVIDILARAEEGLNIDHDEIPTKLLFNVA